jgi:hypothetical protein
MVKLRKTLHDAMGGWNWHATGWLPAHSAHHCTWLFVGCDADSRVTAL